MSREQLGAHTQASDASLAGRQQLIDQRLGEVQTGVRTDLDRLSQLVQQLGDATSRAFRPGRSLAAGPRRDHPDAVEHHQEPARGVGQLERSWPMGRADGRRRASPCRLPRGRQLPQAHRGGGRGSGHSRLHVPPAEGPRAVHGRQVPDGFVPPVPRRHHRGRAFGPPGHLRARRACPRPRACPKREYASTDDRSTVDNVLLFVPNETISAFIHENDPELIDEAMSSERRHLLAAHPVRVPRGHPPGVRQLRDRADQPGDPAAARQVRPAVGQVHRVGRQGEATVRHR